MTRFDVPASAPDIVCGVTEPYELRHRPTRKGIVFVRVWPLVLAAALLAASVASLIGLAAQEPSSQDVVTAVCVTAVCTIGAGFFLYRAWRTWPAVSPSLVVMRLDQEGPHFAEGSVPR